MHAHCASGCCGNHAPWPCPCPSAGNPRLPDAGQLVSCFQQTQGGLAAEEAYYSSLATPGEALREALLSLTEPTGLRPIHQPLPTAAMAPLNAVLMPAIEAQATTDDIISLCDRLFQAGGALGLTPVMAYDIALRLGMQRGIAPQQVFIHDGNGDTLAALGITVPVTSWFDPAHAPTVLRALPAAEIELCLCLCRSQWQWLASNSSKEAR